MGEKRHCKGEKRENKLNLGTVAVEWWYFGRKTHAIYFGPEFAQERGAPMRPALGLTDGRAGRIIKK